MNKTVCGVCARELLMTLVKACWALACVTGQHRPGEGVACIEQSMHVCRADRTANQCTSMSGRAAFSCCMRKILSCAELVCLTQHQCPLCGLGLWVHVMVCFHGVVFRAAHVGQRAPLISCNQVLAAQGVQSSLTRSQSGCNSVSASLTADGRPVKAGAGPDDK